MARGDGRELGYSLRGDLEQHSGERRGVLWAGECGARSGDLVGGQEVVVPRQVCVSALGLGVRLTSSHVRTGRRVRSRKDLL